MSKHTMLRLPQCLSETLSLSLVNGYGRNGMGIEAVELYREMPVHLRNSVTDVCVLSACSHSGLVDQARSIFSQIEQKSDKMVTTMVGSSSLVYDDQLLMLVLRFRSIVSVESSCSTKRKP